MMYDDYHNTIEKFVDHSVILRNQVSGTRNWHVIAGTTFM